MCKAVREAWIIDAVRTPIGRHGGALARVRPTTSPPSPSVRSSSARASTRPLVDDVVLGCANQAGEDNRNVARMAALLAGLLPVRCRARR
jgi:acetyl-CoA acetyltransferase